MNISNYHISIGNSTDTGKVREHNEDYMAHFDTPVGYCIIICDGMGGHAAGEVASQNAITAIQQFLQDSKNEHSVIPVALKNAIEFANYQLREMVNQKPSLNGMGTTCVLALISKGRLYTAHAGDSRIYLARKGNTRQLTKDHSSVQKLIDMGVLTEAEAELSDKKHQISKAVGIFEKTDPEVTIDPITLHNDDIILLCSDGLTAHVNKEKINELLQAGDDVQEMALNLIKHANDGGGSDNITVQVVHYAGKMPGKKGKSSLFKKILLLILIAAIAGIAFWMYKNYKKQAFPITQPDNKGRVDSLRADSLNNILSTKHAEKESSNKKQKKADLMKNDSLKISPKKSIQTNTQSSNDSIARRHK